MASAMICGILNSKLLSPSNIIASAKTDKTLDRIKEKYEINTTKDSVSLVKECDIVVVAVKPNVYEEVLKQIKDYIDNEKIIVTIAAGVTIKSVEDIIGNDKKIIRREKVKTCVSSGHRCFIKSIDCPTKRDDSLYCSCSCIMC